MEGKGGSKENNEGDEWRGTWTESRKDEEGENSDGGGVMRV